MSIHSQNSPSHEEEDEDLILPADTLAILQTFLAEKAERDKHDQALAGADDAISTDLDAARPTFDAFEENWVSLIQIIFNLSRLKHTIWFLLFSAQQLSQFWYNAETKRMLAAVCRQCQPAKGRNHLRVALLSCPSLYDSVRAANAAPGIVHIFEYDNRFAAYGSDFVHYDYNLAGQPEYLGHFDGYFDLVIADPPFLSAECIEKISTIIRRLVEPETGRIILCSGEVVADWADKFMNLRRCAFRPEHERNLGNEFTSYANFDLDELIAKHCSDVTR